MAGEDSADVPKLPNFVFLMEVFVHEFGRSYFSKMITQLAHYMVHT